MGDVGKFTIEVILMLTANLRFEVVAGYNKVSFEKDADGVVDGRASGNQL